MIDEQKSKERLIEELSDLRQRIAQSEAMETEYRQAEAALRESEARYRALVEQSLVGVYWVGDEGFLYQNEAGAQMFGYRPDEMVGRMKPLDLVHPDDRALVMENIQKRLRGEVDALRYTFRGLHRDGTTIECEVFGQRILYQGQSAILGTCVDITERKRMEDTLRRERDLLDRIMDTSPAGITVVNREGQIAFANAQAERVLGLTRDEITQRTYNDPEWRITDYDGDPFPDEQLPFWQVMDTGQLVRDVRHAIEWPDGRRVLLSINASPLLDEAGQVDGMVATIDDVTEQVRAEQALQESEQRYRSFVQNFQGIAFRGRMDFTPTFFHGAVEAITGYTESEFLAGKPRWDQVVHADDWPAIHESVEKIRSVPHYSTEREYRIVRKDGQIRWLHELIQNICDDSGKPVLVQGALHDITERKQAEEALRESEARYRALVESSSDHVFMLGRDGTYLASNSRVGQFGLESGESLVGRRLHDVYPPEVAEAYRRQLEQVLATGQAADFEHPMLEADGYHHHLDTLYPIHRDGQVWAVGGICRDITGRVRAREAVRRERDKAQQYLDIASVILVALNEQGEITLLNRKGHTILGYGEGELLGKNWFDTCLPTDIREEVKHVYQQLMAGEIEPVEYYENPVVTSAGEERIIAWHNTVLTDETGNIIGTLSSGEDITERQQAEERLRTLSLAIEQSASAIAILDTEGNVEYANPKVLELYRISPELVLGQNWRTFLSVHSTLRERLQEIDNTVIGKGVPWKGEVTDRAADGESVWREATIFPVKDTQDSVTHYVYISEDITERKRAEEMLLKNMAMLTKAQELGQMGSWEWDLATNLATWSEQVYQLYGLDAAKDVPTYDVVIDTLTPEYKDSFLEAIDAALIHDEPFEGEYCIVRPDGTRRYTHTKGEVVRDQAGNPIGMFGMVQDITERKQAEEEIRRYNQFLKSVLESLTHPFYVIDANDYKIRMANPATAVFGTLSEGATCYALTHKAGKPCEGAGEPCPLREVKKTKKPAVVEHVHYEKDGSARIFQIHGYPILDSEGQVVQMIEYALDITARKRAEDALRASEQKFRSIVEQSQDGIVLTDEQGIIIEWNRGQEQIIGLKRAEVLGQPVWDIQFRVSPEECKTPALYEELRHAELELLRTGQAPWLDQLMENEIQRPDGTCRTIQSVVFPIETDKGVMIGGISRDITERKQAERALERRAVQLTLLNDIGSKIAAVLELNKLLDRTARLVQEKFGYHHVAVFTVDREREEVLMRARAGSYASLFPLDYRLGVGEGMVGWVALHGEKLRANDVGSESCYINAYPDLIPTHSELSVPIRVGEETIGVLDAQSPYRDAFDENDVMVMETLADQIAVAIDNARLLDTEREQRKLAETLREVASTLNSSLDPEQVLPLILEQLARVVEYDNASVVLVSDSTLEIVAHRGFDAGGPSLPSLQVTDLAHVQEVIESQLPDVIPDVTVDARWRRWPESQNVRCWLGIPLAVHGRIIGLLSLGHEQPSFYTEHDARVTQAFADQAAVAIQNARLFTEAQTAYEELKQAQAQLIQSAKMAAVGGLAAGVAHELNNPLTAVLGFAELLMLSTDPDDPAREDLSTIAAEARRARDIVRNLLDFSRQTESFHERADVNQIVQDTLALVRRQILKGRVTLEENYATGLPLVSLAVDRMKQVFLNLITNALNAMPQGGTLTVSSQRVGEELVVRITDTGIGIPEEQLSRIFEPFFTTKPVGEGTGLGLSISLGIVQEHGGHIEVESQPGQGSTFAVWLPTVLVAQEVERG